MHVTYHDVAPPKSVVLMRSQRLTVPELPYSAIDDAGARMYKGERLDTRPVNGDDLASSEAGRFDSEPGAL